jgi:hypothetical protein
MTRTNPATPRAELPSWDVNILRLTRFYSPGTPIDAAGWWSRFAGAEPDSVVHQPKAGIYVEAGR